jgi:hypothetical protein
MAAMLLCKSHYRTCEISDLIFNAFVAAPAQSGCELKCLMSIATRLFRP